MNFGGFASPERNFVFDVNGFDESQARCESGWRSPQRERIASTCADWPVDAALDIWQRVLARDGRRACS